jgi:hypothetical protein
MFIINSWLLNKSAIIGVPAIKTYAASQPLTETAIALQE